MSDRESSEPIKWRKLACQGNWLKLPLLLLPISLMLICYPDAITQDGPAHLASGKIANELIAGKPVVKSVYQLQLKPLPNWAGQAAAMLALQILPEKAANCLLNLLGLWLPALALNWLAQSFDQRSTCESWARPLWISISGMNVVWLFGFTSFLIGLAFAWVMIGLTWRSLERKTLLFLILTTLGWCLLFLSHLVAYALAGIIFGVILACYFLARDTKTGLKLAATTIPSLFLLINYRRITGGTKLELIWEHLDWSNLTSLGNWARQIGWIDPVSLASKRWVPMLDTEKSWAIFIQPVLWLAIAAGLIIYKTGNDFFRGQRPAYPPFFLAWVLISLIGLLGPDTLGKDQGHYLPQRVCLAAMGLFCLTWPATISPTITRLLVSAWVLQVFFCTVFITESCEMAREIRAMRTGIRPGSKVVAIFDTTPWPFRPNPRLHRDALLVFAGDDIASFNLYEAGHAYFPLQFQYLTEGLEPERLEQISLMRSEADLVDRTAEIGLTLKSAETYAETIVILGEPETAFYRMVIEILNEMQLDESQVQVLPE